jgi:hypothetical protein
LASVIQSKPDLVLGISQDINYTQAVRDQSLACLKTDYYIMTKAPGKLADSLDMLSKAAIADIRDNDPALLRYADMRPNAPADGDIYAKAMVLYKDKADERIGRLASQRNQLLIDYMVNRMQAPAASIKVETMAPVPGKAYDGKSAFKTSLVLSGEELMTASAESDSADDADKRKQ